MTTTEPNARQRADWLRKVNPYKQAYLADAFRFGARTFWSGKPVEVHALNSRERAAFWKGYDAAEGAS